MDSQYSPGLRHALQERLAKFDSASAAASSRQDAASSRQDAASFTQDAASSTQDAACSTQDAASSTRDAAALTKAAVPFTQDAAALTKAAVPFTKAAVPFTKAAVALTIVNDGGVASLIVTRRASRLKDHGGQWALPGGRVDPGETSQQAARRELEEEVSLTLQEDALLGTLDPYFTRSGYEILPVVFWSAATPNDLQASPDEVQSIHMFSFDELKRKDSPNLETIPESDRQVLSMNYVDDVIYAPTAAMLYQFREVCLFGLDTRVAHFDQPVFAWK